MQRKQIVFTKVNTAELLVTEIPDELSRTQVLVRTAVSTVSPGTERANITGDPSVSGNSAANVTFPRFLGYSSAGEVVKVGEGVTSVAPGDRVVVFWGVHAEYNLTEEANVVKIPDGVSFREAAAVFISVFPLNAIRKTKLEIGEPCLVMGLGLLGQFAVRLAKAAGAAPVIAADPVPSRREDAVKGGADYAFDPLEADFAQKVIAVSDGGIKAAIEVTGVGAGLDETLDCMARFGRVALLGCTRDRNFTIDYYRKVHFPGISLIGAHTLARAAEESHHGDYTHRDDIRTVLKLLELGRLDYRSMLGPLYAPAECPAVYDALIHDKNFPMTVQFDWSRTE